MALDGIWAFGSGENNKSLYKKISRLWSNLEIIKMNRGAGADMVTKDKQKLVNPKKCSRAHSRTQQKYLQKLKRGLKLPQQNTLTITNISQLLFYNGS